MDATLTFEDTLNEEEEFDDMGSYNHSLVQGNIAYLIRAHTNYSAFVELSLDASPLDSSQFPGTKDELIPNVCIYPRRNLSVPFDILKMKEMPLLTVEVLSPRQFAASLINKFNAYFTLGVQSCWLVDPTTRTVHVYSRIDQWQTFLPEDTLNDPMLNIQLPVSEIFQ